MSELVAARAAECITMHDPLEVGTFVTWVCMDDRPVEGVALYRQIGGGAHGFGTDVYMAERMEGPVHEVGSQAARRLKAEANIRLLLHEGCAAEGAAEKIAQTVVERPEEVFAGSQVFLPGISRTDFQGVQNRYAQTLQAGGFASPQKVAEHFNRPESFVPRVPLADMPHVARDILVGDLTKRAFVPSDALKQDTPAYYVSSGDLEELHEPSQVIFPGLSLDGLRLASAVRHAAIALNLPQPDGEPLQLHRIGESGLQVQVA